MKGKSRARRARRSHRPATGAPAAGRVTGMALERHTHPESSPRLTGGALAAACQPAGAAGDEAVGGSTATPDQDVVDELGEALGVPQASDEEFRPSVEILAERDRHRWRLEREIAREEDGA